MEKLSALSEDQGHTDKVITGKFQDDMPADLKVNDVITLANMQEKVKKTLQEKLEAVSNQLVVMNEHIVKAKEELIELENIFNELHEKFNSKYLLHDNAN